MFQNLIRALSLGAILLTVGCNRSPTRFAKEISRLCPTGWQVSASNNVITLRREAEVWWMPHIGRPAVAPSGETKADFFRNHGGKGQYEVWLEFVPRLSQPEYEKLKAAREQAYALFNKGTQSKSEYGRLAHQYDQSRVPSFFTMDFSIFVDRPFDPRFVEVYPPEAASEIEVVIKSLAKLFRDYEK